MDTSSIEITEQEYLIKLRKEEFDLSFIYKLVRRIQYERSFPHALLPEEEDRRSSYSEDLGDRFDHLSDK